MSASSSFDREDYAVMAACAVVVILRSYVGFAVSYPWRTGIMAGVVATACIVLGKMLGGLCMCAFGKRKTILASLLLAALCYVFLAHPFTGLLSLLFFNMTMPITLCLLVSRFPAFGGFMFGLLTAALFVGYPLSYVPLPEAIKGWMLGVGGCIISCLILLSLCRKEKKSFQKEVV
ncbi:MAG: hypothetical protein IIZ39_07930 [Blautia sp.]|nr:hypothetical protein [Blautia sp.]